MNVLCIYPFLILSLAMIKEYDLQTVNVQELENNLESAGRKIIPKQIEEDILARIKNFFETSVD